MRHAGCSERDEVLVITFGSLLVLVTPVWGTVHIASVDPGRPELCTFGRLRQRGERVRIELLGGGALTGVIHRSLERQIEAVLRRSTAATLAPVP